MKVIKKLIVKSDILGVEAGLYANDQNKSIKTLFGGFISLIIILLITAATSLFTYKFLNRSNFDLISNTKEGNEILIKQFNKVPFLLRVSADKGVILPLNFFNFTIAYSAFDVETGSNQKVTFLSMKTCDIHNDQIFKDSPYFKTELFSNITNVNTFLCPVWKEDKDLFGVYGSTHYSYIIIFISSCKGSNINDNGYSECADINTINDSLGSVYLDFITVTNQIDHYSSVPNKEHLYQARIPISNSIFKRIWFYYDSITYSTDGGYIFEHSSEINFFKVNSYSVDVDMRNVEASGFAWITIVNNPSTIKYERGYMKAQTLLANVGGIIKGLTLLGFILNYPIANNIFNMNLINNIYDIKYSFVKETRNTFSNNKTNKTNNMIHQLSHFDKNTNDELKPSVNTIKKNNFLKSNKRNDNDLNIYKINKLDKVFSVDVISENDNEINKQSHNNKGNMISLISDNNINNINNVNSINNDNNANNANKNQSCNNKSSIVLINNESVNNASNFKILNKSNKKINTNVSASNNLNNIMDECYNPNYIEDAYNREKNKLKEINSNLNKNRNNTVNTADIKDINEKKDHKLESLKITSNNNNSNKDNKANNKAIKNPFLKSPNLKQSITNKTINVGSANSKTHSINTIKHDAINNNIGITVFKRREFKFSWFNLIDPIQCCLFCNKSKKQEYTDRLSKAQEMLNINNMLSLIQDLNILKRVVLNDTQLLLIENMTSLMPNMQQLQDAHNDLKSRVNKFDVCETLDRTEKINAYLLDKELVNMV